MNRAEEIKRKYFLPFKNEMKFMCDCEYASKIMKMIDKLTNLSDSDEMYSVSEDTVMLLDYIGFDSAKSDRLSPDEEEKLMSEMIFEGKSVDDEKLDPGYSMENYRNNLERSFSEHYDKIHQFKRNFLKNGAADKNKNCVTGFFIEDLTEFGNLYKNAEEYHTREAVILPFCDFFLDLFEKSPELDFAICAGSTLSGEHLWLIDRNSVKDYRKEQVYADNMELICGINKIFRK